ncbi:MAG: MBL fold metallo-hydrolase [Alphaproteobacteria bacterium]|nr:MBL fold metallo-hydrolase [Alphaproteobacteria bacterium]
MKVTILGSGAAAGVPVVSRGWMNCDPDEPRNRRLRPSILVESGDTRILVDTGPDLREQLLAANVRRLDAVLYTHAHADHIHGIDDLREVNRAMRAAIDVWARRDVLDDLGRRFGYVFDVIDLEKVPLYKPLLTPRELTGPIRVGEVDVVPFDQDHGFSRTTGFRFGPIAYSTDVVDLPEDSFAAIEGVEIWIVGCLIDVPHETHAHVDKVIAWADRVKPKLTVLTHMSPRLDYQTLIRSLPPGIVPGYDGMVLEA